MPLSLRTPDASYGNPESGSDCYRGGNNITASLALADLPPELTLEVQGSVSFSEPWTLSWPVE